MSPNPLAHGREAGPRHHWSVYVLLALLGGMLTFAGARAQQKASDAATFRKLIEDYCAAWSSGNAAKFYAKDDGLIFYDLAPFSYQGWNEYELGVHKNLLDNAASASLTAGKELKVTRHGNIAWTSVPMHFTAKMKDGKSWVLVHEHLSVPLGG